MSERADSKRPNGFGSDSFPRQELHVPMIDLDTYQVDSSALAKLPREMCEKHTILPVALHDDVLVLAVTDPPDLDVLQTVARHINGNIAPVTASHDAIERAVKKYYQ
jgi:type IV pilus assembly protein PilB